MRSLNAQSGGGSDGDRGLQRLHGFFHFAALLVNEIAKLESIRVRLALRGDRSSAAAEVAARSPL